MNQFYYLKQLMQNLKYEEQDKIILMDSDDWQSQRTDYLNQSLDNIDEQNDEVRNNLNEIINHYEIKVQSLNIQLPSQSSTSHQNPKTILIQGYIIRKINSLVLTAKKKYLVLTYENLYMYEQDSKTKILALINLKLLSTKLLRNQLDDICLEFNHSKESFVFKAIQNQDNWIQNLNKVILRHVQHRKINNEDINEQIFDGKRSLLQNQFLLNAETGDLLLLKTMNSTASLQRFVTQSQYDHVAMIVKFKDEIKIFESNEQYGVNLYTWNNYFNMFNYHTIAYRKLHYLRKTDAEFTLLRFVKKNIGNQYELGFRKLLKINSNSVWQDQPNRSYFCSQLIGKAYKAIGLLQSNKSSAKYWPIDFTQKGSLFLMNGAYLGSENHIILNRYLTIC